MVLRHNPPQSPWSNHESSSPIRSVCHACRSVPAYFPAHLRWWPPQRELTDLSQESSQHARFEWAMFMSGAMWPIILSGMAGYFVCFWPGRGSQRRILWAVCLPAILGVGLICIRYLSLHKSSGSILESGNTLKQNLVWAMVSLWELGPGLRLSV